jgi:hypothetical protein
LSQVIAAVLGRGWMYYVTIGSLLAVLCLSANTSFVDFPRLCRLLALDGFLPRAFSALGRRLVYSVGVVFLAVAAMALLILFHGVTDRLIPLFAVGAFMAFSLSQAGMVMHWRRQTRNPKTDRSATMGLHLRLWINGIGALATIIALFIILAAKFVEGAWLTLLAIGGLLLLFRLIHHHYAKVARDTRAAGPLELMNNPPPVVLLPTKNWDRLTGKALRFGLWLSNDVIAVHLSNLSGEEAREEDSRLHEAWRKNVEQPAREHGVPVPRLVMAQAPYRSLVRPLLKAIDRLKAEYPHRAIAVLLPEMVEKRWWQWLLHDRKAARLRAALLERGDHHVIVVEVPWFVED